MADYFVQHPIDVISLGQQVKVKVVDIDLEREKVALSMKSESNPTPKKATSDHKQEKKETPTEHTMKGNISRS